MKKLLNSLTSLRVSQMISLKKSLVFVTCISFIAWVYFYIQGFSFIYNDAMSHLNISRMVVDNLQPGFAQLGGVWLPLSHILPLVFIWNDWAWHSGFAGSVFSMISYVLAFWSIFKIVYILTKKYAASLIAGFAFVFNLNMLYLQSTALTEPLYIGIFSLSALCFTLLVIQGKSKYLIFLGLLGFLQVLTRYDGWFVVAMEGILIAIFEIFVNRKTIQETFGKLLVFGMPILFGIGLWLLWNILIFDDALFFALGPYSAHAQQEVIKNSSGLLTKSNIYYSMLAYGYTMLHNIGSFVLAFAVAGLVGFFSYIGQSISKFKKALIITFLCTPIIFNILALYLGFSIVNVPELNWNPSGNSREQWFNVRYGILALPAIAVFFGFFASWKKVMAILCAAIIVLQMYLMSVYGIATITDGTYGSSAFDAHKISSAIQTNVKPNDTVLMSIYSFNPVAFKSGIQLKQIIHEGVNKEWPLALKSPQNYADWVIMANSPGDPVYSHLIENNKEEFLRHYEHVFTGNDSSIYRLKK